MSHPNEQQGLGGLFGFRRVSRASNGSSGAAPAGNASTAGHDPHSSADNAETIGTRKTSNPVSEKDADKLLGKLLKKAKPFFDEKLKPKARLQALYAFLGGLQARLLV
jgi:hypothetical protein